MLSSSESGLEANCYKGNGVAWPNLILTRFTSDRASVQRIPNFRSQFLNLCLFYVFGLLFERIIVCRVSEKYLEEQFSWHTDELELNFTIYKLILWEIIMMREDIAH